MSIERMRARRSETRGFSDERILTRRLVVHPFRAAVEARDADAVLAVLADDVVFRSPMVFKPYSEKEAAGAVLSAALRVVEDFVYEAEIASADGRDHALMFRARVDEKEIRGCDFLHHDG